MYQLEEFEFKEFLPSLQNVSDAQIKKLYHEWLDYYDKKEAEGYDMKGLLSEQMYRAEYRRIQKAENEARAFGGTLINGSSVAEYLKKHSVYTTQKQAEAIYEGVMEKWNSLSPADQVELIKKNPALKALYEDKGSVIARLRREGHRDMNSLRYQLFKYYPGSPSYNGDSKGFYWSPKSP